MKRQSGPRTLILATSYAPEMRRPELRPKEYPRTDYVELAKILDCDILDYSIYDDSRTLYACRGLEKRLRLDFHLALLGYRRARDYDVVLLMSERVAIPYMMMQKLFGRRAATVYVSAHSSPKQARLVRSLGLFRDVSIAVTNTNAQVPFLVREMRIPEDRVRCVLYAADERFYVPGEGGDYILSSGMAYRDYRTLFAAVGDLPVKLKLAAGGRFYSLDFATELPPIPENVEFVPPTDNAGMRELNQHAAAIVVPLQPGRSDAAGCSAVLEGMCCGRPVIASHTKGMEDYIHPEITGKLVEAGNPDALKNAVLSVLGSEDAGRSLGRGARLDCEARLSLCALVDGLARAINDAVDAG